MKRNFGCFCIDAFSSEGTFWKAPLKKFVWIFSLQETFAQLDLDGDGRLSKKEIEKALGNVLSEADFNELLTELDADQSGEVDWQEFVNVMKIRMREPESVKMLKEAFR